MIVLTLAAGGCALRGKKAKTRAAPIAPARITTIGVNAWLWRASLETIGFMPIGRVDSAGGVIVTDWYQNPRAPAERVKVSIFILDTDLRADALRVAVARQIQSANGGWIDAPVAAGTTQKLEETILTRARDTRRAALAG